MGGKKGGKSSGVMSQGLRTSSAKTASKDFGDRIANQLKAFREGKKVMVTIENPNKNETNKRFIRVPASQVWKK